LTLLANLQLGRVWRSSKVSKDYTISPVLPRGYFMERLLIHYAREPCTNMRAFPKYNVSASFKLY